MKRSGEEGGNPGVNILASRLTLFGRHHVCHGDAVSRTVPCFSFSFGQARCRPREDEETDQMQPSGSFRTEQEGSASIVTHGEAEAETSMPPPPSVEEAPVPPATDDAEGSGGVALHMGVLKLQSGHINV